MLRIRLDASGRDLVACSRNIGKIDGEFLCVHIKDWLAEIPGISEGSAVSIDNADGEFNISPADSEGDQ